MQKILGFVVAFCGAGLLNGCGGSAAPPKPTVTISASSDTVTLGQSATLTWSSTNVTSCTASANPGESDWSGPQATSGSLPVTPPSAGKSTYTLQCTGANGDASQAASVTASIGTLTITSGAPPEGTVGAKYSPASVRCNRGSPGCFCLFNSCRRVISSFPFSASGGVAPYEWAWVAASGSSLPPGLTVANSQISGTPTQMGAYNVVVTVSDSQSPAASTPASYTITIHNPPPPTINTDPPPSAGALNLPYTFTFAGSGYAPLTWSESGSLPPGLALSTDGTLSGTPTKLGSYSISVTVTDGVGQASASDDVTIEIFPHGFKTTGSMGTARAYHTATLLTNGKVLVTGGTDASGSILATAELYNPATGSFSFTGSLGTERVNHTATSLGNGKVLVTGGGTNSGPSGTAELFDPVGGTFSSTGNMTTPRTGHTATLLNSGKVLVTGGVDASGSAVMTAELYDPGSGSFASTGSMTATRTDHTATLLSDGTVLVTGGFVDTAEVFDPTKGTFTSTGKMSTVRTFHSATLLTGGKVLVAGGLDGDGVPAATAELFDASAGAFASTGNLGTGRYNHRAVLLQDGTVLVTGGFETSGLVLVLAELSSATGASFTGTGSMTVGRALHRATRLSDGRVLVTGGADSNGIALAAAELYQ